MAASIEVESKILIVSDDGLPPLKDRKYVVVTPHWNRQQLVWLKIGKSEALVAADGLIKAIRNAQNAH